MMRGFRTQIIYVAIALLNALLKWVPGFSTRRGLLRVYGVRVTPTSHVHRGLRLSAKGRLTIGANTVVNRDCFFDNRVDIRIGDSVSVAHGCRIYTLGHDIQADDFALKGAPVIIEDHAVLFAHAMVMPGVTIRRGAVVYAGAVISRDVPAFAVVAGNPARVVRARPEEACRYELNFDIWLAP